MTLKEKIINDFKEAFKSGDVSRKAVLSMLMAEIKNKEIALISRQDGLSDDDTLLLLRKAVKQRKEAAEIYRQGKREELAKKEEYEADILIAYLPQEIGDAELREIILQAREKIGASDQGDLGKIMKEVMPKLKDLADGSRISRMIGEILKG